MAALPATRHAEPGRSALRPAGWLLACAAAAAWPFAAGAATWDFEPRVSLSAIWTDNVTLADSGLEESEWIGELKPGFLLGLEAPRATAQLEYDLQALWFADNSELDEVYHQLLGNGRIVLAPETLFLDADASYGQLNISPAGALAPNNYYFSGNRTDALIYSVSPYHVARWGHWGESVLRYSRQGVRYRNTDETDVSVEDSDTDFVAASLGSPAAARGASWLLSGSYARTEFDVSREFEYARVALDVGWPVGLRTRLTGTVGLESDVEEDPSQGGLDASFWYVGFAWAPTELQSLEARVGRRFYGTAVDASYRRRGSRGEFGFDYLEEPSTGNALLAMDGTAPPGTPVGGTTTLDASVFVLKRFAAIASYEFVRSRLSANAYTERREFQDLEGGSERTAGLNLGYEWDVAPRTTFGTTLEWRSFDPRVEDDVDYFGATLRLRRQLTRTLAGILQYGHFFQNADLSDEYRVNQASLAIEGRF